MTTPKERALLLAAIRTGVVRIITRHSPYEPETQLVDALTNHIATLVTAVELAGRAEERDRIADRMIAGP